MSRSYTIEQLQQKLFASIAQADFEEPLDEELISADARGIFACDTQQAFQGARTELDHEFDDTVEIAGSPPIATLTVDAEQEDPETGI